MWFPMGGGGGGGGGGQGEEQKPTLRPPPMVTTTGYWYSDHHHQIPQPAEICYNNNPAAGMEMAGWRSFLNKTAAPASGAPSSSSKTAAGLSAGEFYTHHHQDFCNSAWVDQGDNNTDSSSSLRCVFPCEGNERPSHGLSLSLSSANPSTIGLQSFELRAAANNPVAAGMMNHGFFSEKPVANHPGNSHNNNCGYFEVRESKYLGAAQELLNEFCSLGTSESSGHNSNNGSRIKKKKMACNQWQEEGEESTTHNAAGTTSDCSRNPCLDSLDLLELHNTQTKLLLMLQEVDRRYRQYCDEMKAVVSSFDAVAGDGAGKGYTALAAKAMSRHFRCLRDGIVTQLKVVKKAAAQKDRSVSAPAPAAAGTSKGETPRLKILDQALRQQKAFQQMSLMEAHPWRPQRGLPERSVSLLRAWLFEHFLHPYPNDVDKHILARQTGLSRSQVSNWFINARVRLWKPMVEEMYLEETKEQENQLLIANSSLSHDTNAESGSRQPPGHRNPNTAASDDTEDHKPNNNLVRVDISSIFNSSNNNPARGATGSDEDRWPTFGATRLGGDHRPFDHFGFSSSPNPAWGHENPGGAFGYGARTGGGGGVSLTLGLQQQQGGSGMGLAAAFSPSSSSAAAAAASSAGPPPPIFYTRPDQIEDCQTVPYPLLDSEGQNLPYRNLIGAQLLHDLAG